MVILLHYFTSFYTVTFMIIVTRGHFAIMPRQITLFFSPCSKHFRWGFVCFSLFDHEDIETRAEETEEGEEDSFLSLLSPPPFLRFFTLVPISARSNSKKRTKPKRKRLLHGLATFWPFIHDGDTLLVDSVFQDNK